MASLSVWLSENKLSLHLGKTECILFGSVHKINKTTELNILCNNVKLSSTTSIKYLGALIDQHLSGNQMYESVIKKISSTLRFFYRNKRYLCKDVRKMLVNSLIQPRFDYACNLWYRSLTKTKQKKLQVLQNKSMRFILGVHNRFHLGYAHFEKLNLLNVNSRVNYITLCHTYNIINGSSAKYLEELVEKSTHKYNTRSNVNSLNIVHVGTFGKCSFKYNSSKMWNELPAEIKTAKTKCSFKILCKKHLMKEIKLSEESSYIYY